MAVYPVSFFDGTPVGRNEQFPALNYQQVQDIYHQYYKHELMLRAKQQQEDIKIWALEKTLAVRWNDEVNKEMSERNVLLSAEGELFYSISSDFGKREKRLLDAKGFKSSRFFSSKEGSSDVLMLSFIRNETPITIYLELSEDNLEPKKLRNKFATKGIKLKIARSAHEEVFISLISLAINTMNQIELSEHAGWNLMKNGNWHYSKSDEPTMQDLRKFIQGK